MIEFITKPLIQRFLSNIEKSDGCWLYKGHYSNRGYGVIATTRNGAEKKISVHRLAWMLSRKRKIPKGLCVCHHCDVPLCVRPNHLFLGTLQDNIKDKVKKGRHPRGTTHGQAKLTEKQVRIIRILYQEGEYNLRELSSIYKISMMAISRLINRKTWKHIK